MTPAMGPKTARYIMAMLAINVFIIQITSVFNMHKNMEFKMENESLYYLIKPKRLD